MEGVLELDDSRLSVVNNYVAPAKQNYKQSGKIKFKDYGDEDEEEENHAAEPVKVSKFSILATQIVSFELRRHTFVLTVKDENNNNSDGKQLNQLCIRVQPLKIPLLQKLLLQIVQANAVVAEADSASEEDEDACNVDDLIAYEGEGFQSTTRL